MLMKVSLEMSVVDNRLTVRIAVPLASYETKYAGRIAVIMRTLFDKPVKS
jgi:hypothetical protein